MECIEFCLPRVVLYPHRLQCVCVLGCHVDLPSGLSSSPRRSLCAESEKELIVQRDTLFINTHAHKHTHTHAHKMQTCKHGGRNEWTETNKMKKQKIRLCKTRRWEDDENKRTGGIVAAAYH